MRSAFRDRAATPPRTVADSLWVREELYFGTDIPGGGMVTDSAWQRFLDNEITPRFPQGLTVLTGDGQYMYHDREIVKEKTRIVILFYREQVNESPPAIAKIISAYKKRFSQESVLRVRSLVRAKF